MWSFLRRWAGGSAERRDDWQVVMYTRRGCCLCDQAWEFLQAEQRRLGFALARQDVDVYPELSERYGTCVPVVTVNGKVRFRGKINPILWKRLMHAGGS